MKTKLMAALTVALGAVALAACGSSSDTTSSSTTASTSSSSDTTSTSSSGASVTAFCSQVKVLKSLGATFSSLAPNDIAAAQSAFQAADNALHEVADVSPAEIKSDSDAVATAFDTINGKIQGASSTTDVRALGPELRPIIASLRSHTQSLKSYAKANC